MPNAKSPHRFYIPIMGTGFTIDTALAVAKYGISSVLSLVDDVLIEQMRKCWCERTCEPYQAISATEHDSRAKRITAYLNLLNKLVQKQIAKLKSSLFESDSEITRYFELLPDDGNEKQAYQAMLSESNEQKKHHLQQSLRQQIIPGSIDVNIMTKIDRPAFREGKMLPYEYSDAAAALRGYAQSDLDSSVVFSAGFNPHLYGYLTQFEDFFPDQNNALKKRICLKVSDYRSATIQGKYLAKHGLWVSEYRIESPLNCGGHAFINDGQLFGPILEEFKQRKDEFVESLHALYKNALKNLKKICSDNPHPVKITAQGGVGTHEEHEFLMNHYKLDAVGWGSPFLLVPEVTNVDAEQLNQLLTAQPYLSNSSPLGIPFWNITMSASENARRQHIEQGTPGSLCRKGFAKLNTEFGEPPICMASREYQQMKLEALENDTSLSDQQLNALKEITLNKSCICHDLAAGATIKNNIDLKVTGAICPGPNLVSFNKIVSLKDMVAHIYGRLSLLTNPDRPHLFISELRLQINYLLGEIKNISLGLPARSQQKLCEVKDNLSKGVTYYQNLAKEKFTEHQEKFLSALQELQKELEAILIPALAQK
ncbi:MAG: hypothetical protein A2103_03975 [Gammaproteobacteria bacterium GWF2_41_13]|nr:MAG: hypothetical protein A2103_03975 [Gammaproteobacteria bacterium GWF2_41_13]